MSAEKLFDEMKAFVDAACKEKNHSLAVQAAEKFGFQNFQQPACRKSLPTLGTKISLGAKSRLLPNGTIHLARFKISLTSIEFA